MTESNSKNYNLIAISDQSTVVADYNVELKNETAYESEAALEAKLINALQKQAYEYLKITSDKDLTNNLRKQLEKLNHFAFTDSEWDRFFNEVIAAKNSTLIDKTFTIQTDNVKILDRDDGTSKNITLIDKEHIHNNTLQVINQYETRPIGGSRYANRYDVTILVNGLPMVHIELKRRGVNLREAFNQIERYKRDSFWADSGLFDYVQLFVISNGTLTKYYSNTTRHQHVDAKTKKAVAKAANSFEFTSYWADAQNKPIEELEAFTKTFFSKHTILNILTRYCVFTTQKSLLVMRPYQIVATEKILERIKGHSTPSDLGTIKAGGFIWHTTGSGKTLTSFKTAQLTSRDASVDKVLFVVDRKDLDYQTVQEYDNYQKGAANSNVSSAVLKKQLEDNDTKIIVTTIQKLSSFVKNNKSHSAYSKHVVLIFDECHRSQFGSMHSDITRAFKRYNLFGFTGTPILPENATKKNGLERTTSEIFGDKLHTYTIVDAIRDKNVLKFRIDYVNTIRTKESSDQQVSSIATEDALMAPERIKQVTSYILEHFDQKTRYKQTSVTGGKKDRDFNAMFATASIQASMRYYEEFKKQQDQLPEGERIKVALIYSFGANDPIEDGLLPDETFDPDKLPLDARAFLDDAIKDYSKMFGETFDTSSEGFQKYYQDLSNKLKTRGVDLVIVVNMFLTGFDSKTLNTLFVDKPLKTHGLMQAYSRTNRILNSVKTHGNIVSFRNLEKETDEAIALFGNKDSKDVALMGPYKEYYEEYQSKAEVLLAEFDSSQAILSESKQREFVQLFGQILQLRNILGSFDDFIGDETIAERQVQDYSSRYLDLHSALKEIKNADKESILDDLVFEIELIKQVEINIDYIIMLVDAERKAILEGDTEARDEIMRAVTSSPTLRSKSDLIESFVNSLTVAKPTGEQWEEFIEQKRNEELKTIINAERLDDSKTKHLIERAFREGSVPESGQIIAEILPKTSRFTPNGARMEMRARVLGKISIFFEKFYNIGNAKGL